MPLLEQLAKTRLILGGAIQSLHECFPSLFVEYKARLVRRRLLRLLASTAHDEFGDGDALAVRRYFDEFIFRGGRAKLEPAVALLFGPRWKPVSSH